MNGQLYSPAQAVDALQFIDPGQDRHSWVRVLASAKAAGISFDDALAWSSRAGNFSSERDVRSAWRSINPTGPVQAGTLFHEAREQGWKPAGREKGTIQAPRPAPAKPEPQKPDIRPGMSAAEILTRCVPASAGHEYVRRKSAEGAPLDGLGVLPADDSLRIVGESMAGALVVPVRSLAGELRSLQVIPVEGQKKNLPGHSLADGLHVVGDLLAGAGRVYIVEGIGQAWSCWKATGRPAVVSFGASRTRAVAEALKQAHPGLPLVLVPDAGQERQAHAVADELDCSVVEMPEGSPRNYDTSDFLQEHGADALAVLLESVSAPAAGRFKFKTARELAALPPLKWLVKGVLPQEGIAALFGPSGSGKSFLGIDLAAHVAEGLPWFGRRVEAAPVVYLALEGEHGLSQRVRALELRRGGVPAGLHFVAEPFNLLGDVPALAAAIKRAGVGAGLVVVDTLNRAASGIDENSAADMGQVIDNAKALQAELGGLVLLVHHSGKDVSRGLRGHSSLHAALDAAVEVCRNDASRSWKVLKAKDGEDGVATQFRLEVVGLGADEHGDPVTSCVVAPDESASEVRSVRLPQGGNQRLVLEALRPLFRQSHDFGKGGAPEVRPCLNLELVLPDLRECLAVPQDKKTSRTREAVVGLVNRGVLGLSEGWIWLV